MPESLNCFKTCGSSIISSGQVASVGAVAASRHDPEDRLHDKLDGEVDKGEGKRGKRGACHNRLKGEPDQPQYEGLRSRLVIVTVPQDALVDITSRRLSPHVSVMQRAGAGKRQHLPEDVRYKELTVGERINGRLKDEFGGRHVRVRGAAKVMCHCVFGVLALTADQLMRLVT